MKFKKLFVYLFCSSLFFLTACKTSERLTPPKPQVGKSSVAVSGLAAKFDSSEVFSNNFTGFALYSPEEDSLLFQLNGNKYFTPASNTKLYTFFAALKFLPDSILSLEYTVHDDSLIFWGTGDPTFLHPDFDSSQAFTFLKNSPYDLYYSDNQYRDELLGPGWAWGDYQYYYSTEKTPFPMYGNVSETKVEEVHTVQIAQKDGEMEIKPKYFQSKVEQAKAQSGKEAPFLFRDFNSNTLEYSPKSDTSTYIVTRPFHYTPQLISALLSDTLGKEVHYIDRVKPKTTHRIYGTPVDTIFTRMLQPSDNFIAEQLLLNISAELGLPMNSSAVIKRVAETYFTDFEETPEWVDGSGLSRYNLFTPKDMVHLLRLIDDEFAEDSVLFHHLPAGGKVGTIRNWYANREGGAPYVFAKTGTLSNNHCLSGYIITEKGHKLIFSFMNNHYVTATGVVKTEMEKILWYIYKNY